MDSHDFSMIILIVKDYLITHCYNSRLAKVIHLNLFIPKASSFDKRQLKTTNTNPIAQKPAWATDYTKDKDKVKVKNAQKGELYSNLAFIKLSSRKTLVSDNTS